MSRTPNKKELVNTRLANNYGGWTYCDSCNKTIGYLCYVTYEEFHLSYQCKCGNCGSMHISFEHQIKPKRGESKLVTIKNRLCCPNDSAPLFTLLTKNLEYYKYEVHCSECNTTYVEEQNLN